MRRSTSSVLSPDRIVKPALRRFSNWQLQPSLDAFLVAALTGTPCRAELRDRHLAIVDLAKGRMREFLLNTVGLRQSVPVQDLQLHWSPDCGVVLVSSSTNQDMEVFIPRDCGRGTRDSEVNGLLHLA